MFNNNDDSEIMMTYDDNLDNYANGFEWNFTHINLTEDQAQNDDKDIISSNSKKRRVDIKYNFHNNYYHTNIPNTLFSTSVLYSNELSRTQTPQPCFNKSISSDENMEKEYVEKIVETSIVYVKNINGQTSTFSFMGNDISIRQLKILMEEKWNLSSNQIRLMHGKIFVDDDQRVNSSSRLFMIAQVGS